MKSSRIFIEILLLCALISSCSSTNDSVTIEENVLVNELESEFMSQEFNKKLSNLSVKKHFFQDDNVLIEIEPAGDRMYLSFTNNSKYRIVLHIESATVKTMLSEDASQIITFDQSKQITNHFTLSAIIVNPGVTFSEKYVALDSMEYDAFKSHQYVISEWANDETFQLSISYGLVTVKGEIVKSLIIK